MADEHNDLSTPDHNPTVPGQPQATAPLKTSKPLVIAACVVVGIIGIANVGNLASGHAKNQPAKSALPSKPVVSDSGQVNSFQAAQARQAQHDQAELLRQQEIAAQAAILTAAAGDPRPRICHRPGHDPGPASGHVRQQQSKRPAEDLRGVGGPGSGKAKGIAPGTTAPAGSCQRHGSDRLLQLGRAGNRLRQSRRGTRGPCRGPGCSQRRSRSVSSGVRRAGRSRACVVCPEWDSRSLRRASEHL